MQAVSVISAVLKARNLHSELICTAPAYARKSVGRDLSKGVVRAKKIPELRRLA